LEGKASVGSWPYRVETRDFTGWVRQWRY